MENDERNSVLKDFISYNFFGGVLLKGALNFYYHLIWPFAYKHWQFYGPKWKFNLMEIKTKVPLLGNRRLKFIVYIR